MLPNQFQLLKDLPTFLATFPKAVQGAHVLAHKEAITTWRDRPVFPGLAHRFTWGASKSYGFSMRRQKYGSPTALRVHYAKNGLGMPAEARPGGAGKSLRMGASRAPNRDKPWFVTSGGTKAKILKKRVVSRVYAGQVISRFNGAGWGVNATGGNTMRGVTAAAWVYIPVTYQMRVYKDSVNKAGGYTRMVTRAIPRWVHTYATRTYRQEYEDLTHDLPFIQRVADAALRNALRDLVIDERGRVRLRYRKAIKAGELDAAEVALINGGA